MQVLVIGKPNKNKYLEEVIFHSNNNFLYGNLDEIGPLIDVVLFQWPEELFGWHYPTDLQLLELESKLLRLKSRIKTCSFVHNLVPHHYLGKNQERLFEIVYGNMDALIHFGEYSKTEFEEKYPQTVHIKLNHSLYRNSTQLHNKNDARKKLGLPLAKKIIIIPGKIRTKKEKQIILKLNKYLNRKGAYLIVLKYEKVLFDIHTKGYYLLKKLGLLNLVNNLWNKRHLKALDQFNDIKDISDEDLSIWVSASDGVLIIRDQILNSGVFFLGLTFEKKIISPMTGNLKELVQELNTYGYKKLTFKNLKRNIDSFLQDNESHLYNDLTQFEPSVVSERFDVILDQLMQC